MLLSVCIPTYNRSQLLKQTLDELLPQIPASADVEVVISDNASPDDTVAVVEELQTRYSFIRLHRNDTNIGADDNAMKCLDLAQGRYFWFCSDDDVPLPGLLQHILSVLRQHEPKLVFLNHTGFLDGEHYSVVKDRNPDRANEVFTDGEEMLARLIVNHFSATILHRDAVQKHIGIVDRYKAKGYGQGYARGCLTHAILLDKAINRVSVFIGMNGLAVRNPALVTYDPVKVVLIDVTNHYQRLREEGLISTATEQAVMKPLLRDLVKVVIPEKAKGSPHFSLKGQIGIMRLLYRYPAFYTHILPALLMPRPLLAPLYFAARAVYRKRLSARIKH